MEMPVWTNKNQKETIAILVSCIENLQLSSGEFADYPGEFDGAIIFEGDGEDGPAIGYIETNGEVTWVTGG